jgi:hypothetical protein
MRRIRWRTRRDEVGDARLPPRATEFARPAYLLPAATGPILRAGATTALRARSIVLSAVVCGDHGVEVEGRIELEALAAPTPAEVGFHR